MGIYIAFVKICLSIQKIKCCLAFIIIVAFLLIKTCHALNANDDVFLFTALSIKKFIQIKLLQCLFSTFNIALTQLMKGTTIWQSKIMKHNFFSVFNLLLVLS